MPGKKATGNCQDDGIQAHAPLKGEPAFETAAPDVHFSVIPP